jgi:hypothetical protein
MSMSYDSNDYGESRLARQHRRRKKVFGWVVLVGLSASILGGAIAQIFN